LPEWQLDLRSGKGLRLRAAIESQQRRLRDPHCKIYASLHKDQLGRSDWREIDGAKVLSNRRRGKLLAPSLRPISRYRDPPGSAAGEGR